jgi:YidC/Oxa1 family membrane protein insertase
MPNLPLANILQPLIDIGDSVMQFFHDSFGLSWGFSIIALTVAVRAVLLPLTLKQFKSMQSLQRLQPQLKEIQAKYKDDRERLSQEMMKFYRKNQVNPLGSCLPLLAQIPVFIALYYLLRTDLRDDICGQTAKPCGEISPGSAEFFFIPDITDTATGIVLIVLLVLYAGTQIISTRVMMVTTDPMQRRLMMLMPLAIVVVAINLPAGLLLYWITTNIWTIGQQLVIKRTVGPITPLPTSAPGATVETGVRKAKAKVGAGGKEKQPTAKQPNAKPPRPPRKRKKRTGRRR